MKRTHLFPDLGRASVGGLEKKRDIDVDELNQNQELRRLARAFGLHPEELVDKYDDTRREVRHLHLDIYYRPMLPVNAQMENDQIVLSVEASYLRQGNPSAPLHTPCGTCAANFRFVHPLLHWNLLFQVSGTNR